MKHYNDNKGSYRHKIAFNVALWLKITITKQGANHQVEVLSGLKAKIEAGTIIIWTHFRAGSKQKVLEHGGVRADGRSTDVIKDKKQAKFKTRTNEIGMRPKISQRE